MKAAGFLIQGKDAGDYFHRMTSVNFKTLSDQPKRGLFLNSQGKILCVFEVKKISDAYFFLAPWKELFLETVEKFRFSEQFSIEEKKSGEWEEPSIESRIQNGIPALDFEIVPQANPLEVGISSWIDSNKGCYPGQEVIEKIISLGSPARRLCQVALLGEASPVSVPLELDAGLLTSFLPSLGLGLAVVRKTSANEGAILKSSSSDQQFKVSRLSPS